MTARDELISSLGALRPLKGRLVGFSYAGYGGIAKSTPRTESFRKARIKIERELERHRSAITLGNEALLKVLSGRLDDAVNLLEEGVKDTPENADLSSDLAAVFLGRGESASRPIDFFLALTYADRAIATNGTLREARFNRALALEHLGLARDADPAWQDYLLHEPNRAWSLEASSHMQSLRRPSYVDNWEAKKKILMYASGKGDLSSVYSIVAEFPQPTADYAEEALGDWADELIAHRQLASKRSLLAAQAISSALAELGEEHLVEDTVAGILSSLRDPSRLTKMAMGIRQYRLAASVRSNSGPAAAAPIMLQARSLLERAGSVYAKRAWLAAIACSYEASDFRLALAALDRLGREPKIYRYPYLRARAHWIKGMCLLALGRPAASLEAYLSALRTLESLQAAEDVGALELLVAENYRYLGQEKKSWEYRYKALIAVRQTCSLSRHLTIMAEAAEAVQSQVNPQTALYFRNEVVQFAAKLGDPLDLFHALLKRAETYCLLHKLDLSSRDVAQARIQFAKICDNKIRRRWGIDLLLMEASLEGPGNLKAARAKLNRALADQRLLGNHYGLARLLLTRAQIALKLGKLESAQTDLLASLAEYESERTGLAEESLRISYFGQARQVVDAIVQILLSTKRTEAAFVFAERARARAVLDRWRELRRSGEPLTLRVAVRRIPPATAVLEVLPIERSAVDLGTPSRQFITSRGASSSKPDCQRPAAI